MKISTISILFLVAILASSCFGPNVRFIESQPESLEELTSIPEKFQGTFVIDKDTIEVTDRTISGDTINSNTLVVKGWGNYLFVNSLENGVYKLGCAKVVNVWDNEELSVEYFVLSDDLIDPPNEFSKEEKEKFWMEEIDKMIADENNPIVGIDSTERYLILDNVSINQFQSLLNHAESEKVTRIK